MAAACGSEKESGGDVGIPPDGGTVQDGGLVPLDLAEPLAAGQVRAGRIAKEKELIGGMMARGKVGDFKLYNSRIRVVVEGARKSDGWGATGGTIADADIVRSEGEDGRSLFGENFAGYGIRVLNPEKAEVINDGRDGNPAVVRITGPDDDMPFAKAALSKVLQPTMLNTTITTDYVLAPDSDILEIKTSFPWTNAAVRELDMILQVFIMGDGLRTWMAGPGFNASEHKGATDVFITAANDVSYAFFGKDETISQFIRYEGINFYSSPERSVRKGDTLSFTRYLAVGGGGVDPVLRTFRAYTGASGLGIVGGKVTDGGAAAPGARVHALGDIQANEGHRNQAVADGDGRYSLQLPAGSYRLVPYSDGHPIHQGVKVTVAAGQSHTQDLALPEYGTLNYAVTTAGGGAIPAKIFFARKGGADQPPASFGEQTWGGHQWIEHSPTGSGSRRLPPGEYTVTASHGYEYTLPSSTVTLAAGGAGSFSAVLERVVDTKGFISSDFHLHSMDSPDSDVPHKDRVASLAAAGLEAPISTDHDYISDWRPAAKAIGVAAWTQPIVGSEITTYTYGHFNAWPLAQDPSKPNMGGIDWYYKLAPQLFAEILALPSKPVLILNHFRTASIGGYFSAVEFDRKTGTVGVPDNWSENFTAFEIINGGDLTVAVNETLPDWYYFLNRGKRYAGASGSDVHAIQGSVGNVRNYIASSTDDPAMVSPDELADNVRAQKLLVTTGPFINVSIEGKGMGETAAVTSGNVQMAIKVQAPLWMNVTKLSVISNGTAEISLTLDDSLKDPKNPVVRFNKTIEFVPAKDTWYVALVEGDSPTSPITGPRPFAFTNPIYVDRDGNGRFDPPAGP
jgi:hypothetical protein